MGDRCLECGFAYNEVTPGNAPERLRSYPPQYRAALVAADDTVLRTRPSVWTWSALEYGCHVRDVFDVYIVRAKLVLAEERPPLDSMQRDARVVADRYNEQDPTVVADQLAANAEDLAGLLEPLGPQAWERTGVHPVTGERTLLWMTANVVHEARHHLLDIERVTRAVGLA